MAKKKASRPDKQADKPSKKQSKRVVDVQAELWDKWREGTIELKRDGISVLWDGNSVFFSALNAPEIGHKILRYLISATKDIKNKRVIVNGDVSYQKIKLND